MEVGKRLLQDVTSGTGNNILFLKYYATNGRLLQCLYTNVYYIYSLYIVTSAGLGSHEIYYIFI